MDAKGARESVIRPKLETVLGKMMTNIVLTKAILASQPGRTEAERHRLQVEAICTTPQVVKVWGQAGVQSIKIDWLKLIR